MRANLRCNFTKSISETYPGAAAVSQTEEKAITERGMPNQDEAWDTLPK
jgi:hypothetical protein